MQTPELKDLNDRARDVFRQLVEQYLGTGEPVGSRTLSKLSILNLSPASIRNVMQDLEEMGLLASPHTSAGRIPTDLGLRLFVDGIMQLGDVSGEDKSHIEAQLRGDGRHVEDMLAQATQVLSGLSSCAGLVVSQTRDVPIRQIDFVPLAPNRMLAILVGQDGSVENRAMDLPPGLPPAALSQAANYINTRLAGLTLEQAKAKLSRELTANQAELNQLSAQVAEKGLGIWTQSADERPVLIVRGQANLLETGATQDLERVRRLLDDIEAKQELVKVLDLAREGQAMRIFIGSENKLFSLSGSSVIAAPYRGSDNKIVGVIGVIGPTRLNYARIVPMVDYTAKVLSRLIT
jgi:heat-inducible transcriptional repressor